MNEKSNILEAWIMVEHLSEGDIRTTDRSYLTLDNLQGQDFYALFQSEMKKRKLGRKGGIAVFFDIFSFREVVDILRRQYQLQPTDEELQIGNKFSFALYFDKNFNFLQDMTFFTESAYIRYYKKVPREEEFREFEDNQKTRFTQDFDKTAESPEQFNKAVQAVLQRFGIAVKTCRMKILNHVETEGTNLHSFFISDLEKAKNIDTWNLNAYLGGTQARRVNLDSKKESKHFHPGVFEKILQPVNYPLGRFPSNTEYALSLMQQVAVNLSTGVDSQTMRSVNGPPGTGKTTLLKDIFAQLVVQQACDIAKLPEHRVKGTEETVYYERASIGVLPVQIAENGIVVASSNNGAVQNIVKELPLCQGIDKALLEDLKKADYFREISNAEVSSEWKEDENGKRHKELVCKPGQGEEKFWGTFSLEGGKADNMTNILTTIEHIHKYLEEEYQPDDDVYAEFLKQYEEVRALRNRVQTAADSIRARQDCAQQLAKSRISYQRESAQREKKLAEDLQQLQETGQAYGQQLPQLQLRLEAVKSRRETAQKNRGSLERCLDALKSQKPGLFAGRREKEDHRNRLAGIADELLKLQTEDAACDRQESELRAGIARCQAGQRQCAEKQVRLQKAFDDWRRAEESAMSGLEKKLRDDAGSGARSHIEPLDMNQEYDRLQLSNPWFDEAYRIAQSKLFLTALRVRKQFLYENRRNLRASLSVWNQQEKYLEKKPVIEAAWNWINMAIPVISSTFASFSRMCRNLGPETMGHLFIDEAGQALPQAAVGAVYRSRHVMVVGDPSQIKPVLTLDSNTLGMLGGHFGVTEKYLSASASTQTLVDAASQYGFYRKQEQPEDQSEDSWIGIPLWVHRRCQYPMFTISNMISYDGYMVQGMEKYGKTGWFDVAGKANNKYVQEQGDFLVRKIQELMKQNPKIADKKEKDVIYVITPFSNVAFQLSKKLHEIGFTRYGTVNEGESAGKNKPTNVGTVHTFQGKEAPVVFFVLGADQQSSGAAKWAVSEPNMMNVAATRAKEEFYIIGDKKLYCGLGCDVVSKTDKIIRKYKEQHPELVEDTVEQITEKEVPVTEKQEETELKPVPAQRDSVPAADSPGPAATAQKPPAQTRPERVSGKVTYLRKGSKTFYAYVAGDDGVEYSITETIYSRTDQAETVIQKGARISFVPRKGQKRLLATDVKPE